MLTSAVNEHYMCTFMSSKKKSLFSPYKATKPSSLSILQTHPKQPIRARTKITFTVHTPIKKKQVTRLESDHTKLRNSQSTIGHKNELVVSVSFS